MVVPIEVRTSTTLYRGNGAKEARLAHNQKTVGAIPTPAIVTKS
jgi:hypothetical protein